MSAAVELFAQGLDTVDIAKKLGRREASVLREINQERAARLGLPDPYARYVEPKAVVRAVPKKAPLPQISAPRDVTFRKFGSIPLNRRQTKGFAPAGFAYEPAPVDYHDLGKPNYTSLDDCGDLLREWGVE